MLQSRTMILLKPGHSIQRWHRSRADDAGAFNLPLPPVTTKSASRAPNSVQRNSLGGNFGRGPVVATPAPNNGPEIGGERLA